MFRVSERARCWNKLKNARQTIDEFQILRVTAFIRLPAPRMIPNPRTNRPQKPSAFPVLSFESGDVEPPHARATHQLGHAVDDDHCIVMRLIERSNKAGCGLAIHNVNK